MVDLAPAAVGGRPSSVKREVTREEEEERKRAAVCLGEKVGG